MSESKTDVEDVLPDPDYKARTIGILIVANRNNRTNTGDIIG
jgi:hypothetical protein